MELCEGLKASGDGSNATKHGNISLLELEGFTYDQGRRGNPVPCAIYELNIGCSVTDDDIGAVECFVFLSDLLFSSWKIDGGINRL